MTADERLEKLLNRFGQTIVDLHDPQDHTFNTFDTVMDWYDQGAKAEVDWASLFYLEACESYISHLTEIIDRMEAALETATNTMDCRRCEASFQDCNFNCNEHSKVANWQLSGMYHSEFKEFVEGEGQTDA